MAKNQLRDVGRFVSVSVAAGTVAGDPVRVGAGDLTGIATNDRTAEGKATIDRGGSYKLSVYGHNGAANSAVAEGDKLYLDAANKRLDKNTANPFFGWALAAVAGGATTTIEVLQKGGNE